MIDFGYYYNGYKTLSYNALFNFIIGNRGGGKSYFGKYWAIADFLKTGKEFIYVRRYKKELKKVKNFFSDISDRFSNVNFEVKGNNFYVNEKLAGYAIELSTSKIEKSNSFPNVNKIIFDEFIIDKGVYHYLPNEVEYFLEFYETIARQRDVKVMFFANAISQTNPYFLYFNIVLPYGKNVQTFKNNGKGFYAPIKSENPDLLIELVENDEYIKNKMQTRFGQLIAGTEYSAYAIENNFLRDSTDFLGKKPIKSIYQFGLTINNNFIGVWYNTETHLFYLSKDREPGNSLNFAIDTESHNNASILTLSIKSNSLTNRLIKYFVNGMVRFENINIKNIFYELAKKIRT